MGLVYTVNAGTMNYKMTDFDTYVSEKLQDPEFQAEYDALEREFAVIHAMLESQKAPDKRIQLKLDFVPA